MTDVKFVLVSELLLCTFGASSIPCNPLFVLCFKDNQKSLERIHSQTLSPIDSTDKLNSLSQPYAG